MKKVIYIIIFVLISIGGVGGIYLYKIFYESNTLFNDEYVFIKIPTNSTENQLLDSIAKHVKDLSKFSKAANYKDYFSNIKPGRYKLEIITTGRKKMATPTAFALFDEGHEIEVTVNQNSSNYIVEKHYEEKAPKDLYNTFKVTSLGEFNLTKGMNSITLKALKINFINKAGFSLRQIRLIPIP